MPITSFAHHAVRGRRRREGSFLALVAAVMVTGVVVISTAMSEPSSLARLTIVNPTSHGVNVTLRSGVDEGHFLMGWVAGHDQATILEVPDQGDTWIVGFSYAGVAAGEQQTTRGELERSGWRFEIPSSVADVLSAAGLAPAYRDTSVPQG